MNDRIKVRLKTDLTKYGKGLVSGIEGWTMGSIGEWSRSSDRFVFVDFPNVAKLDVLWEGLEIIDEEYLESQKRSKAQFQRDLKSASDVTLALGPRGGFKYLSYQYTREDGTHFNVSTHFKEEAENIIQTLKEYNIPIKKEII